MSAEHCEPLARLTTTGEAVEDLRNLFAAEEPLEVITRRVAETAVAAIPRADVVSITVLSWPDAASTVAYTDEQALELDHQQYASGRGPCLEAAWERTPLRAVMSDEHERWPEFVEAAQRTGIRASLSVPLLIARSDEQELVGSLNIYSHAATEFDEFDAELMHLYSVAAGQAISNANCSQKARETVTQFETALHSRSEIDMAKGALMALHGCSPDEAFARLADESQRRNIKLRDVAREMLNRIQTT